ncbi:MAG TPA: alpha/beta fold hydrolase [Candidatus Limnocylindrales bacterium]|nr:alpha/beta fold hydrolase [Candidatus Limnocylindrales bacterium]
MKKMNPGNTRFCAAGLLGFLAITFTCAAQQVPAPRMVDLTATDGTKLKASFFPAGRPGPGVLLLHQCNLQRKGWDGLATQLAAAGISVLTLDYRGYGDSEGKKPQDLPPAEAAKVLNEKWPADVDVAYRFLVSQPDVNPRVVGAGGASCGVNLSIHLAIRHPEVKSLVLLSGNADRQAREFLTASEKMPLLLSAANDDNDAVELMQWLYSLSSNPGSKFLEYPDGGHGVKIFAAHEDLPVQIVDWFVQTLVKTPGSAPVNVSRRSDPPAILKLIDSPGGAEKAAQQLAAARKQDPHAKLFNEGLVNAIGYEHLQEGDNKGAIEILKLNVSAYPDSANVYDSLSDAYLADGQKDLARENAKKALQVLATDTKATGDFRKGLQQNAEEKLKQLGDKP